jgi:hypothetical protein
MKNKKLLAPLMIAISLLALTVVPSIATVRASPTGLLYINPPSTPQQSGGTFSVQVKVANMPPFNGWDIAVATGDPKTSPISPVSISVAGNLFKANFSSTTDELINCVNGSGMGCVSGEDGPGIIHSALVIEGPLPMSTPSSGLLFTITYSAGTIPAGKTVGAAITIFDDLIFNGTPTPVAHSTQDGKYGTPPPTPDFTISATPGSNSVVQGNQVTYSATLMGSSGFAGTVTLSASFAPSVANGPTAMFDMNNPITLSASTTSGTSMLTVSTTASTPVGTYDLTVTGTNTGGSPAHSTSVLLDVIAVTGPDYTISTKPTIPTAQAGYATFTTMNLTSMNGFVGDVSLTSVVSPIISGVRRTPIVSYSIGNGPALTTFHLSAGQLQIFNVTIQTFTLTPIPAPSPSKLWTAILIASSGSTTHSTLAPFAVSPSVFLLKIHQVPNPSISKDAGIEQFTVTVQNNGTEPVLGQVIVRLSGARMVINLRSDASGIVLPPGNTLINMPGPVITVTLTLNLTKLCPSMFPDCLVGREFTWRGVLFYSDKSKPAAFTGETVVYDSNGNGVFDSGDIVVPCKATICVSITPAAGTTLSTDAKITFVDTNLSGSWAPGKPVIYDKDANGVFDTGKDIVISGAKPANQTALSSDPKLQFVNSVITTVSGSSPDDTPAVWNAASSTGASCVAFGSTQICGNLIAAQPGIIPRIKTNPHGSLTFRFEHSYTGSFTVHP